MKKLLFVALVAACGGSGSGSGIDSNKKLADLTASEVNTECNYLFDTYPQVTVTCPGGTTITKGEDPTKRAADCNGTNDVPAGCTVTVGQSEACLSDVYHESDAALCSTSTSPPASCVPLFSAACQGTGRTGPMTGEELLDLAMRFTR
jgi:hypothetical protein